MSARANDRVSKATSAAKGLVAFAVAIVPILLPDAFVPRQLDPLRQLGTGIGIVAAMVGFVFAPFSRSVVKILAGAAAVSAVGALVLSVAFLEVVPVAVGEERAVVVGFHITERGQDEIKTAGLEQESRSQVISRLGYDRIPVVWGWSYHLVLWSMAMCLLGLIACTTISITSLGQKIREANE